jgi:transcription initiation factor IIE alpha subunit
MMDMVEIFICPRCNSELQEGEEYIEHEDYGFFCPYCPELSLLDQPSIITNDNEQVSEPAYEGNGESLSVEEESIPEVPVGDSEVEQSESESEQ